MEAGRKGSIWQRVMLLLGSAMVLMFFSELFFGNEGPVRDLLASTYDPLRFAQIAGELTLWYALLAAWLLVPIFLFKIRRWEALLLAGMIFGWATEGVVVPLLYAEFPLSIVWPSMAWHGVVDVMLGWWLLRLLLLTNRSLAIAGTAVALGLFWGWWMTWSQVDAGFAPMAVEEFARFAFAASAIWLVGNFLVDRSAGPYRPAKWEWITLLGLGALMWMIWLVSMFPLALIFPLLVGLAVIPLVRNQKVESEPDVLQGMAGRVRWHNQLLLALTPIVAVGTYALMQDAGLFAPTDALTLPTMLAALILVPLAVVRLWRARPRPTVGPIETPYPRADKP